MEAPVTVSGRLLGVQHQWNTGRSPLLFASLVDQMTYLEAGSVGGSTRMRREWARRELARLRVPAGTTNKETTMRVEHVRQLWGDDGIDGGYCPVVRDGERTWMVRTPNGHLGDLGSHDVTEHEDSTITVSPSILVSDHTGELYHGFLERGVWRSA